MSTELERFPKGKRRTKGQREAEEVRCLELKILGTRDIVIAEQTGLTLGTVKKRIADAIARHGKFTVEQYREVTAQQLEVLLLATMEGVRQGDPVMITTAARILERKAKLLGLDAPVRVEMEVTEVTTQERELADLLAQAERDAKLREAELREMPA